MFFSHRFRCVFLFQLDLVLAPTYSTPKYIYLFEDTGFGCIFRYFPPAQVFSLDYLFLHAIRIEGGC